MKSKLTDILFEFKSDHDCHSNTINTLFEKFKKKFKTLKQTRIFTGDTGGFVREWEIVRGSTTDQFLGLRQVRFFKSTNKSIVHVLFLENENKLLCCVKGVNSVSKEFEVWDLNKNLKKDYHPRKYRDNIARPKSIMRYFSKTHNKQFFIFHLRNAKIVIKDDWKNGNHKNLISTFQLFDDLFVDENNEKLFGVNESSSCCIGIWNLNNNKFDTVFDPDVFPLCFFKPPYLILAVIDRNFVIYNIKTQHVEWKGPLLTGNWYNTNAIYSINLDYLVYSNGSETHVFKMNCIGNTVNPVFVFKIELELGKKCDLNNFGIQFLDKETQTLVLLQTGAKEFGLLDLIQEKIVWKYKDLLFDFTTTFNN